MPRRKNSFSSDLTYIILILLHHSLVPTRYISEITGEPSKKVSKYLNFLKKKGLVYYDNGLWGLTPRGEKFVRNLDYIYKVFGYLFNNSNLNNYLKNKNNESKKTTNIQIYSNLFKNIQIYSKKSTINQLENQLETTKTLDHLLLKAREFLGRELNEVEKAVVEFLFGFSISRGRKYWWPEDGLSLSESLAFKLSKSLGISISSIDVAEALKSLEAAGILFITYDKRRRVPKIRISRAVIL